MYKWQIPKELVSSLKNISIYRRKSAAVGEFEKWTLYKTTGPINQFGLMFKETGLFGVQIVAVSVVNGRANRLTIDESTLRVSRGKQAVCINMLHTCLRYMFHNYRSQDFYTFPGGGGGENSRNRNTSKWEFTNAVIFAKKKKERQSNLKGEVADLDCAFTVRKESFVESSWTPKWKQKMSVIRADAKLSWTWLIQNASVWTRVYYSTVRCRRTGRRTQPGSF